MAYMHQKGVIHRDIKVSDSDIGIHSLHVIRATACRFFTTIFAQPHTLSAASISRAFNAVAPIQPPEASTVLDAVSIAAAGVRGGLCQSRVVTGGGPEMTSECDGRNHSSCANSSHPRWVMSRPKTLREIKFIITNHAAWAETAILFSEKGKDTTVPPLLSSVVSSSQPENILLESKDGNGLDVRISDFGLAKFR